MITEADYADPHFAPWHFYFGAELLTCEEWGVPEGVTDDRARVTCRECIELMHA